MFRGMVVPLIGLLAAVASPVAASAPGHVRSTGDDAEHEPVVRQGAATCGVERWAVKTGIDTMARQVNTRPMATNISTLRSLPPPTSLPARSRIKPVETSTYIVSAILLRYKIEADSDYHLVIADTGGRAMIAEIPAPDCVGQQSPFLAAIQSSRSAFDGHYRVTDQWQRVHQAITITGVGFFDFKHGQSGVAPNAIELHPVLNITFGSKPATNAPVPPTPRSQPGGSFSVQASVSPNPISYGAHATLVARTTPGARCSARVLYSTGRPPKSFNGSAQTVGASDTVNWSWHLESKGTSGTATVTCTLRGATKTVTTSFTITHP